MSLEALLILFLIGEIAGWLAGIVIRGRHDVIGDIIIGILGSLTGAFLFSLLGFSGSGFIGNMIVAFIGAVALVLLIRTFNRVPA